MNVATLLQSTVATVMHSTVANTHALHLAIRTRWHSKKAKALFQTHTCTSTKISTIPSSITGPQAKPGRLLTYSIPHSVEEK